MRAARIHQFGAPNVIVIDEIERPTPAAGEVLIRVAAAGVGPWDAWIREKKSVVSVTLPLILGSDLSGTVEMVGPGVPGFSVGDLVYGVTNPQFCGAYAEFALASAAMLAPKPKSLTHIEAASAPVVAVTAWQMLHDYAQAKSGQSVLIHGAAGNVGAYAVQLARRAQLNIIATASANDAEYIRQLGADRVLDYHTTRFEQEIPPVDIVLDLVGGEIRSRSIPLIKPGGILVSVVSPITEAEKAFGIHAVFFLVEVTTDRLNTLTDLFDRHQLVPQVGAVLPLEQVQIAHQMLAGAPHKRGKIVLCLSATP